MTHILASMLDNASGLIKKIKKKKKSRCVFNLPWKVEYSSIPFFKFRNHFFEELMSTQHPYAIRVLVPRLVLLFKCVLSLAQRSSNSYFFLCHCP